MKKATLLKNLQELYENAPVYPLDRYDPIVVFSDLHIGNGTERDDFRRNGELFRHILRTYYGEGDFTCILNGDIEELHRFTPRQVMAAWPDLFKQFRDLERRRRLFKIAGNHDSRLLTAQPTGFSGALSGLRLQQGENTILVFHGHQASSLFTRYNNLLGFLLRYMVSPLGIRNYSVSHNRMKKYRTEKLVYRFSSANKCMSIIGHTHRPLFESLSKVDSIKFRIEQLCRAYTSAEPGGRADIEREISLYKEELARIYAKNRKDGTRSSLYNANLVVPCLFNSGSGAGKSGITSIEIQGGVIRLVHWFDSRTSSRHLAFSEYSPRRLGETPYYRAVLKQDNLHYIFNRINLLA